MKLLKKFFKQVKLLDSIFIGLFFLIVVFVYLFLKRDTEFITVTYKVTNGDSSLAENDTSIDYALAFQEGDGEFGAFGGKTAEITNVNTYRISATQNIVYFDVKMKAVYDPNTRIYSFKGRPIIFGETHTFTFSKVKVKAMVVDFPGFWNEKPEVENLIVEAEIRDDSRYFSDIYGSAEYFVDNLNVGDKVIDNNGEILVEILEVNSTPAERTVVDRWGNVFLMNDPKLFDIKMKLNFKVKKVKDQFYAYDYMPIIIGQSLPLNFEKVSIWPIVTSFEILDE